jgi:hypothetical protein
VVKGLKKYVLVFAVGLFGFASTSLAFGAIANSAWTDTGTVYGYHYENLAYVENSEYFAASNNATTNGASAPAGYMGAAGHLYQANGSLCEVSGWEYNGSAAIAFAAPTPLGSYCGAGYYYSDGWTRAYTGSGYDTYATAMSPELYF